MSLRLLLALLCLAWLPLPSLAQAPSAAADGRQRLALVVGVATVGDRVVMPSAARDAPALAAALSAGGYQVLLRENPSATALTAAFRQFREALKPDGLGLVYITGPMAQVDGRNLLVPSDTALNEAADAPAVAALLRVVGVPVQEALTALAGPPEAPRVLVLDGAYRVAPLSKLVPPGLARQRTAEGTLLLLGHQPAALHEAPIAEPAGSEARDPKSRAATPLAKAMADALTLSGVTVAEALRAVRLEVLDASGGRTQPALSGAMAARVDFAQKKSPAAVAPAPPAVAVPVPTPAQTPVPTPVATPGASPASAPMPALVPTTPPAPAAILAPPAATVSAPVSATDGRTERAPGGGERPVFQMRANSFGHAEGDVLSYERTDTRKDEVVARYVIAIDKIEDTGMLRANGGLWQLDPEGRPVSAKAEDGTETRFEPAEAWWWARPRAGESRAVQFTESDQRAGQLLRRVSWRGQAQVGTPRVLEVKAGEFEVLPIRVSGQGTETPEGKPARTFSFTRVVYFAPKLGLPVAIDVEDTDTGGRPLKRERIELTHAQQSRTINN